VATPIFALGEHTAFREEDPSLLRAAWLPGGRRSG
jgi:hypothetical protein